MLDFNKAQLAILSKSLVQAEKSAQRLAIREGQPDAVALEYRKFGLEVGQLLKVIEAESVRTESKK